jgi:hypothetical protein
MHRAFLIPFLILCFTAATQAADRLVVHEWGTFTSLQDEQGNALGSINTDDEPVPAFVHQLPRAMLFPPTVAFTSDAKGTPAGDPNVTMRLETPVLYFHPPKGNTAPVKVDVDVAFNGGWLSQYFPDAHAAIDGATDADLAPALSAQTVGRLSWHGVTINAVHGDLPNTTDPVWTAPRAVDSAMISAGFEGEHFLFYRGVGHLDAPLRVERHEKEKTLQVHAAATVANIGQSWLVDIRPDGSVAFRIVPRMPMPSHGLDASSTVPAEFTEEDYSPKNLDRLREQLHEVLVTDGLFADEAEALLNTWQRSYFQNPGERLFFLVPQEWTDRVLPLKLSVPAEIKRVMVGRIELVTPMQRALLRHMATSGAPDLKSLKDVTTAMTKLRSDPTKAAAYNALAGGHGKLTDLGVPVPAVYADFLALGRFRSSLVLSSKESALYLLAGHLVP